MSGGSYDYLYAKEMGERLHGLVQYEAHLKSDLEAATEAGPQWTAETKDWTRSNTAEERAACLAARDEVIAIVAATILLQERIVHLEEVLKAVEWTASGDTCADAIWDACSAWSKKAEER
jgi:hypothetical protein